MIRVLLAVESPVLQGLFSELIAQDPHTEIVVSEVGDPMDLMLAVRESGASVVIHTWPESEEMPGECTLLLTEFPDLLVIGIPPGCQRAHVCRQVIARTVVPAAGIADVLSELRRFTATSCENQPEISHAPENSVIHP